MGGHHSDEWGTMLSINHNAIAATYCMKREKKDKANVTGEYRSRNAGCGVVLAAHIRDRRYMR